MESAGETTVLQTASVPDAPRVLGKGLTVFVTDTDARNRPIAGAEVQLIPVGLPPVTLKTDAAGLCHFPDLVNESYALSVSHDEFAPNRGVIDVIEATNLVQVVLRQGPKILLHVFDADSGKPIPDFDVAFDGDSYGLSSRWVAGFVPIQTEDGSIEVTGVTKAWRVVVRAPGYAPVVLQAPKQLKSDERTRFDFPMHRSATVTGTITDREGRPVANAKLDIALFTREDYFDAAYTDERGVFQLGALTRTPLLLNVEHPDYAPSTLDIPLVRHGESATVNAILDRGGEIRGKVTLDGRPLPNVRVTAEAKGRDVASMDTTQTEGAYTLRRIPPGDVLVRVAYSPGQSETVPVDAPSREATRSFVVKGDDSLEADFAFIEIGSIMEGFVTFQQEPLAAEVLIHYDKDGAAYTVRDRTDDGGWYELSGIPQGEGLARVRVLDLPRSLRNASSTGNPLRARQMVVTIPESGYLQQDFDLGTGASIRGSISGVDQAGGPLQIFVVPLEDGTGHPMRPDTIPVSGDGQFTIIGLSPGTYRLAALRGDDPSYGRELAAVGRGQDDGSAPPPADHGSGVDTTAFPRITNPSTPHVDIVITGEEETNVTLELAPLP
ncbi:MAG: carboxypeptidase regulatory-like domain-containing protein [Candidatus Hydrogenedentes bacterium]|nr:carboxypeptidase regulatory-like domain-containing protein [Candidatus Hydrogenedentota bacterium]